VNAERLALIRQQRADAAKKREEEKAGTYLAIFILLHALTFCSLTIRSQIYSISTWHLIYKFYMDIYA
jgi:hypothetical protein